MFLIVSIRSEIVRAENEGGEINVGSRKLMMHYDLYFRLMSYICTVFASFLNFSGCLAENEEKLLNEI